jgi:ER-bound oxygenase mpaB/B'/Rubber oxygenase, catalytic domain
MFRRRILKEIDRLDPERDHQEIYYLSTTYEFPFDTTRALEFALFRTYAVPSIGGLLDATGEFGRRTQKRYDDTDLLLAEFIEHGYASERGLAAIRRMNRIHGRYAIGNEDMLYVLSTFIFEPLHWNRRFGWRPFSENERRAAFRFWCEVGRRMGIQDIPGSEAEYQRFNRDYERRHFCRNAASRRVADSTRDLFVGWLLPRRLWPLAYPAVYAVMDDALLDALGYPKPPSWVRRAVEGAVRLRGRIAGLLPDRRRPRLRTERRVASYPGGYRLDDLGSADPAELAQEWRRHAAAAAGPSCPFPAPRKETDGLPPAPGVAGYPYSKL